MTPYQSAARNDELTYAAQAMEVRMKRSYSCCQHLNMVTVTSRVL